MQNLTRIDSYNKKLVLAVNKGKLTNQDQSSNRCEKLVALPSEDFSKNYKPDQSELESIDILSTAQTKVRCINMNNRKMKMKFESNPDKTKIMRIPKEFIKRGYRKSKSNQYPVIVPKSHTRENSGTRLPDCFFTGKDPELNGTMNNKINPIKFLIDAKAKPKSKDSVIRFGKIRLPKRSKIANSEVASPTKESDLFDVTFS